MLLSGDHCRDEAGSRQPEAKISKSIDDSSAWLYLVHGVHAVLMLD